VKAPESTLPTVYRLDVSEAELAYLVLHVDASIYVAGKTAKDQPIAGRANSYCWYLKELTAATDAFVARHGIEGLKSLLDRMYRLTGLEKS
jgi:hypothetical protein